MTRTITLIPGDGIGPEVAGAAVAVLSASGAELEFDSQLAGMEAVAVADKPLPDELLDSVRRNGVALKGPVTTPVGGGFRSVNVELRRSLDLYVNLRPIETIPGIPTRYEHVDLVLVRENTEGLYSGLEHVVVEGVVESLKVVSERASTRIAEYAFEFARRDGRKRVTAVHKANIMKLSDGLFLECFRKVAERFPDIVAEDRIVDNMAMQMVVRPEAWEVLVMPNLYGDILSDLGAGLVGGLGVVPGANIGSEIAVFEAVHGSAPDIAGQNVANPTALIRSGAMMLEHLGLLEEGARVRTALRRVLGEGRVLTRDLGGAAGTIEFTEAVVRALESRS